MDEACDAESAACSEMVATVPTTFAGLLALLSYVKQKHDAGDQILHGETFEELLWTTVSALDGIGGKPANCAMSATHRSSATSALSH